MATQVSNFLRKCSATAIGSGRNYMYMLSRVSYSDSIGPRRIPPPKKLSTPLLPPLPYNHSAKRFITGGTGGYVYAIIEFIANYKDVWGGLASAAKFIADYKGRSHLIKCIREGVSSIEERISSIEERISKSAPEIGPDAPGIFTCVIQISKGTKVKYSHDKKSGLIKVDRVLHSSVLYPHNYGVIPRTLRPIGVLIIMQDPVLPGCILRAKAIGLMPMIDKGERDDKILAVGADDPEYQDFKDIDELPPHLLTEVRSFFENEEVAVDEFLPVAKAHEAIQVSMDLYGATFKR